MKLLAFWIFPLAVICLDNGIGKTPAMGWNSWNLYACDINENIVKSIADSIVHSGLKALGYVYITVDDCWQKDRDENGRIIEDSLRFPSGMKRLGNYIHSKGLKFGIYSSAGVSTCMGRPGSLGYENIDAETYAEWGVDLLKYDNCGNQFGISKHSNIKRYAAMRDALNETGRHIYYSMCNWGQAQAWEWGNEIANSWRTTGDIGDLFDGFSPNCPCTDKNCWMTNLFDGGINTCSVINILDKHVDISKHSNPGGFNDLDMLEVGNGGMTFDEYVSHFTLWAALKSPLILGNDIANMTDETKQIISNKEIIALNQDPLGAPVTLSYRLKTGGIWGLFGRTVVDIWVGPLSNNDMVAVLFNRDNKPRDIVLSFKDHLKVKGPFTATLRDLWLHMDIPHIKDHFTAMDVPPHGVRVFRIYDILSHSDYSNHRQLLDVVRYDEL